MHFHATHTHLIRCWTSNEKTFNLDFRSLCLFLFHPFLVFSCAQQSVNTKYLFIPFPFSLFCHYAGSFLLILGIFHTSPQHFTLTQNYRTNEYLNKSIQGTFRTVAHLIHVNRNDKLMWAPFRCCCCCCCESNFRFRLRGDRICERHLPRNKSPWIITNNRIFSSKETKWFRRNWWTAEFKLRSSQSIFSENVTIKHILQINPPNIREDTLVHTNTHTPNTLHSPSTQFTKLIQSMVKDLM